MRVSPAKVTRPQLAIINYCLFFSPFSTFCHCSSALFRQPEAAVAPHEWCPMQRNLHPQEWCSLRRDLHLHTWSPLRRDLQPHEWCPLHWDLHPYEWCPLRRDWRQMKENDKDSVGFFLVFFNISKSNILLYLSKTTNHRNLNMWR